MKNIIQRLFLFSSLMLSICLFEATGQVEDSTIARKANSKLVVGLKKGLNESLNRLSSTANESGILNSFLDNTEISLNGSVFFVSESTEKLYQTKMWGLKKGNEIIQSIYFNSDLQSTAGRVYAGNDYSFDFFILNDSTTCFAHMIKRKPYDTDYPQGTKYKIYTIRDSVIYSANTQNHEDFLSIVKNIGKLSEFSPVVKFSNGELYEFTEGNVALNTGVGRYKNFDRSKANFIISLLFFRSTFGKLDELLLNEKLLGLANHAEQWYSNEKKCALCSKMFTGGAKYISTKSLCRIGHTNTGLNLEKNESVFCTHKCAETYCRKFQLD